MPTWLRLALWLTAVLNGIAAILFTPFARPWQASLGYPDAPDLHLWTISTFILGMAGCYGWMAWTWTPSRPLLALGAYGKAAFAVILFGCAAAGQVPWSVGLGGAPDLVLAVAFATYLASTRTEDLPSIR